MSQCSAYLNFNGNCREAFDFMWKRRAASSSCCRPTPTRPGGTPISDDYGSKVLHARIKYGQTILMGSDAPPHLQSTPAGFGISLNVDTPEEADRIFENLSVGGHAHMPIAETFFAHRFGMLKDKFGMPWLVLCEKPMG